MRLAEKLTIGGALKLRSRTRDGFSFSSLELDDFDFARIEALRGDLQRLRGEVRRLEEDKRGLEARVALLTRERAEAPSDQSVPSVVKTIARVKARLKAPPPPEVTDHSHLESSYVGAD